MALISCPNCGKRITDRTEICPHCNAVLIQKDETPIVSKDSVISNVKKRRKECNEVLYLKLLPFRNDVFPHITLMILDPIPAV